MKTSKNKKGFTLIELLVALGILGIAITSVFSLLIFGQNTFSSGRTQQSLQADNRYLADFIENELTYASKVEILTDKPVDFLNTRRYIYSENGTIMHKIPNQDPKAVYSLMDNNESTIMFNFISNTAFSYDIKNKSKKQDFELSSQIDVLNIDGVKIEDRIKGESGGVISYAFALNSKELIYFNFDKSENNLIITENIEGRIAGNEVILYVPKGTDRTNLKASFSTTGVEVSIGGIVQTSNQTKNDYTNIVELIVYAEDGSSRKYNIRVEVLPDTPPVVQNVRVNPKDPDPTKDPNDWEITTVAWDTSYLFVNEYLFISNGNGSDKSTFKWYISNTENGTYSEINNAITNKLVLDGSYVDKWIKIGVTPKGSNGNTGIEVRSNPVKINKDPKNALWKRIVEDLDYAYMTPTRKIEFDNDRAARGLLPYQIIVKIRDDLPKDNSTPFKIKTDVSKLSLQIQGTGSYPTGNKGGSFVSIDLKNYIADTDGYKVTVEAKVNTGPGWGVMINGTVNSNNKDNGYMFQFDPGYKSGGFVMRRNFDGTHEGNLQFDGLGVEFGSISQSFYSHADLINPSFKNNSSDGWQGYLEDYTTEITIQRQLDHSMIMRVVIWRKGHPNKPSNEMWFGDFGTNLLNSKTFTGISPGTADRKPTTSNSSSYRQLVRLGSPANWDWGSMLGFRTWGSAYDVEFNNISIYDGFSMKLQSAKFIVDNFGELNESSNRILLTFDQEIRNDFKPGNIALNSSLGTVKSVSLSHLDSKSAIVTLNNTINNVGSEIFGNSLLRGAVRQSKAGDIKITDANNFKVVGKVDASLYRRYYKITNKGTSKVLDVSGGSTASGGLIIHYTQNNPISDNQMWELIEVETGVYNIVSKLSGMALEANSSSNNSVIRQRPINLSEGKQKWVLEQTGSDFWIRLKDNNNIRIEATGTQDIKLLNNNNSKNNQKWIIEEINN